MLLSNDWLEWLALVTGPGDWLTMVRLVYRYNLIFFFATAAFRDISRVIVFPMVIHHVANQSVSLQPSSLLLVAFLHAESFYYTTFPMGISTHSLLMWSSLVKHSFLVWHSSGLALSCGFHSINYKFDLIF